VGVQENSTSRGKGGCALKYTIRKFNGDDSYSYAVFKSNDIKGLKGIIMYGQATPIVSGCSRNEAKSYKTQLEVKDE